MPSVRILNGPNRDQTHVLQGGELVGRDPANAIQVFAPGVSRRHFQFKQEDGRFFVEDLGSSNGTYVNNQRIGKHALVDADTITVGGINLRYSVSDEAPVATGSGGLSSSSDEIHLGAFGGEPGGFGANPAPAGVAAGVAAGVPGAPTAKQAGKPVVLREDDEEEAAEDYALDASIVFDASTIIPTKEPDKARAFQKRLAIMFEISQALGELQTLEEMCEKIMDELFAVFPQADRGFVLVGETVEDLTPVVVRNRRDGKKAEVQLSRTIARKVLDERQAILSQNAMEDDRFSGGMSILNFRILSMAASPLLYRDEVFGLIQIDTQDRGKKFTPDDLNLLAGISAQAATFIKNLKLFEDARREAEARSNLERYFTPALASQVASGEIDLRLGGDLKTGTVFFSDIIGFTSMSETLSAPDVISRINRYMRYMVDIVFKYGGSVDKFIGDCVMAVWGVPLPMPDEAVAAVNAAVEMQNALFLFNCELEAEGSPAMHMGIGLNSGTFVAGNMGSERRMEYTVIGDNVNLAQRVESKAGRGMVFVTESTWDKCGHKAIGCRLKPVTLKGKAQPVVMYSIRGVEQPSQSGRVFMTSLPVAIDELSDACERGLLVKIKLQEDDPDKVLGLVLFHRPPTQTHLRLECYAAEMPRFPIEFEVQGQLKMQASHGCCFKGVFSIKGTPLEKMVLERVHESDKSPEDMPRPKTPA